MKVINVSEGTVFLDDINTAVMYSRDRRPFDIPKKSARKSKALKYALKAGLLVDVTDGVPDELPGPKDEFEIARTHQQADAAQRSLYEAKQDFLASADPKLPERAPRPAKRPRGTGGDAVKDFERDGSMSVVWTGPTCFLPDAAVLTPYGVRPIFEVRKGDKVFTHKGRIRRVKRVFSRPYKGPMVRIRNRLDAEEVTLTPDHPVFTIRGVPCVLRGSQTCKPSCKTQYNTVTTKYGTYYRCTKRPYTDYAMDVVPSGNLGLRDFLIMPRLAVEMYSDISIRDYLPTDYRLFAHDKQYIWPSKIGNRTPKSYVAKSLGMHPDWAYNLHKLGPSKKETLSAALAKADQNDTIYSPTMGNRIPSKIRLDYAFGELLGIYVAEGSAGADASTVTFSLNEKETDIFQMIRTHVGNIFGLACTSRINKDKSSLEVFTYNAVLSQFIKSCCGARATDKRIPPFMYHAPDEAVSGFIEGIWAGDGNNKARKKDNSLKYGTSSLSLAYGLRLLLSRFGVSASISTEKPKLQRHRNGKKYWSKKFYNVGISGQQLCENDWLLGFSFNNGSHIPKNTRQRNSFLTEFGTAAQITEIKQSNYDGLVYNLEVEEDNSYIVNGKCMHNCDAGGYAGMNRQMMFGLSERGVNVKYDDLQSMNDMDPKTASRIKRLASSSVPPNAPKVYGMTAPLIYDWSRYKMLFTMMETRRLHPDYVERCNCADEIVVPSRWCKYTFEESGVTRPISVVPLGVDTGIYYPGAEPLEFSAGLKDFVFLSVFGWSLRKGYDVLLKAYLEEFTSDDPVTLLISSRYVGSTDEAKKQVIRDDVARVSSMVGNPKKPHVVLFGDVLSVDMMPRLYASADCYVLPSRGEGFGLPYCEAAACGLPVIATNYSGHTDFMDMDNSYLIGVDGFRNANDSLAWISYFYEDQEFPILGEPAVEQTRHWMRRVLENQDEAAAKAGKLHEKVVNEYNWETCIDQMRDKLTSTYESLPEWEMKNAKQAHPPNR